MTDYIEKHEQMLKQHNTRHIGYIYQGNGGWDYYQNHDRFRLSRRTRMSDETKKRLNTIHPKAKIGVVYIEHYREGYPSEWTEKLHKDIMKI
jgi:hypothetical protein